MGEQDNVTKNKQQTTNAMDDQNTPSGFLQNPRTNDIKSETRQSNCLKDDSSLVSYLNFCRFQVNKVDFVF